MPPAAPAISRPAHRPRQGGRAKSALVIGAGPGGLAAAMLLARAGLHVRVLERLPREGGRCSAIEQGGYRFDLGPTFFL
jgi:phytoene desaturase